MQKKFQRKQEDFTCDHCGALVMGTGYTNHCPKCLWSKHVDVNPGDRGSSCMGMMEPIRIEMKGREQRIVHRCVVCGQEKVNVAAEQDDVEAMTDVMKRFADSLMK